MNGTGDDKYEPMVGFIRRFIQDHGYSPSIREMGAALGHTSTSVTHYWMEHLRRQGRITFVDSQSRTVRVVGDGTDVVLHLSFDEARFVRAWTTDPKATLVEAVKAMARAMGRTAHGNMPPGR